MEPPRTTRAARRSPAAILTTRRPAHRRAAAPKRRRPALPDDARNAALVAAGVLTVTGRGDLWTLALALGVADSSVITALAVSVAGVATLARTGSAALSDINGSQAVLGAAGFTGSSLAVAAAWASAASLVMVGRRRTVGAALGLVAGMLLAGPSLAGGTRSIVVWVLGASVGAAVGWILAPGNDEERRWQPALGLTCGVVGLALGVLAGYH